MPRVIRLPICQICSIANAATAGGKKAGKANRILAQAEVGARCCSSARRRVTLAPCAAPAEIRRGHGHAAAEGHTRWPLSGSACRPGKARHATHARRTAPHTIIAPLACQHNLQSPHAKMLSRRNPNVLPFDDASSLEFLMQKNNCGMFAVASHSKKRPDNLTP